VNVFMRVCIYASKYVCIHASMCVYKGVYACWLAIVIL